MQVWRSNAFAEVHGAPLWFLTNLAHHLAVPIESGKVKKGRRFSNVFMFQGAPYGSLLHANRTAAGLTPHIVAIARYYGLSCEVRDTRQRPDDAFPWFSVQANWRPYQDGVHQEILKHGTGIIDAPPRSGKTMMAVRAIDTLAHPTIYLAPSLAIVRQTYQVMVKHFGPDLVGRLDSQAQPHEKDITKPVVVATPQSALKQDQQWWDQRKMLIIDEFHHSAADMYHRINEKAHNIFYRLCFTGTHFRSGEDKLAMEAVCSTVLYSIPVPYLVHHGWLVPARVVFAEAGGPKLATRDYKKAYKEGIVEREERNAKVIHIAKTLAASDIQTIVLVKRRKHADQLGERIPDSCVVKGGDNALVSNRIQHFRDGRYSVLIGTTVIGEGVDLPTAGALVYASGGTDSVTMMQSYFRPLTANHGKQVGLIYDFVDSHQRTLLRQSERRIKFAELHLGHKVVKL